MQLTQEQLEIESTKRFEIIKITMEIQEVVQELISNQEIEDGMLFITTPHTTAAVSTNEYETRLLEDIIRRFEELIPPEDDYLHDRVHIATGTQQNAHSHIICSMVSHPAILTIIDSSIRRGTWEDILLFDVDGPSTRTVDITILS